VKDGGTAIWARTLGRRHEQQEVRTLAVDCLVLVFEDERAVGIGQDRSEALALEPLPEIEQACLPRLNGVLGKRVGIHVVDRDDEIGDPNPSFVQENVARDPIHDRHL
jgi:hypothetical protein